MLPNHPIVKHEHELTDDAVAVFEQMLDESENPDVEILLTAHELFMHNKKTGYGFFAHFD